MPKICYVPKTFSAASTERIDHANAIIKEYESQGFKLTLRQLYYQFVSRDLIPNTVQSYKNLGSVVNDGRLAGLIDWDAIEDRTRNLRSLVSWGGPGEIVLACASQFRTDRWKGQPHYCEVWIEKDALVGIIEGVCKEFRVPFFACRGFTSQSEMWGAAMRLVEIENDGRETHIIHLGDHDPSGIDMTRDIQDRLALFGSAVTVNRIALTEEQVGEYDPPPNPAKTTDSRYAAYERQYGDKSWELDALEPRVIVDLIRATVEGLLDPKLWRKGARKEKTGRLQLQKVAWNWTEVIKSL